MIFKAIYDTFDHDQTKRPVFVNYMLLKIFYAYDKHALSIYVCHWNLIHIYHINIFYGSPFDAFFN